MWARSARGATSSAGATLLEAGVEEDALERIHGPCGLDIGADTQEETALDHG